MASTAGGKIAGRALERLRPHTSMVAPRGKTLVHSALDLTLFVKDWEGQTHDHTSRW